MTKTKLIDGYPFVKYEKNTFNEEEMIDRSREFYVWMDKRRTVRDFSNKPVPKEVIGNLLLTASSAPSGAHKQPWLFCVVSDAAIKKQIRTEAEKEEFESYNRRMPEEWLEDLRPLQTNWNKEFLEIAPHLIIVFKKTYETREDGTKGNVYYANESCGLACGFLLTAIHHAGLVALTHTPSPMNFLSKVLNRPENEKPFLLIPVGYPAEECWVPDLKRKQLSEVSAWY
ncbi:MAG TPA: nitroreductase family protein [Chitinophagaceae bacterium]|nr:nitroreductase family protein [Chitinophagaceae bacterium]